MNSMKIRSIAAGAMMCTAIGHVHAADVGEPVPDASDWTFTGAAYLWAAGLEGSVGAFGIPPQDVDLSFTDILDKFEFGFMALGEARNGPLSIGLDFAYLKMGTNVGTPRGVLASDIDVTAQALMTTAIAGYALVDTGTAHVDAIAGARLWSVNVDLDFNGGALGGTSTDDGATWVDPLVGAKFRAELGSDFYVSGWGMIGGFGVSSDFMWDVMAGLGYEMTDSFSVYGGYRAVAVDYSDGSFVYDVVQQGPIVAGVFRF
jgi:hypothetical protein